jgi:hypothetical protein
MTQFTAKGVSIIHLTCSGGHKQNIFLEGLGLAWAHGMAGLLDGSSDMFIHDPRVDHNSSIGRCGICRKQVTAVVESSLPHGETRLQHHQDCSCLCHIYPGSVHHVTPCCDGPVMDVLALQVDRSERTLVSGAPVPEDESHRELNPLTGMQQAYVVLSVEERAKGNVRPVRMAYRHIVCDTVTTMSRHIAETYARDPKFYSGTFCSYCREHFNVGEEGEFVWVDDGTKVGT